MIKISGLSVKYINEKKYKEVLNCISLDISVGDIVAIVGESGVGKSTFIKALLGFLPAKTIVEGSVVYNKYNYDLSVDKPLAFINDSFYVPQHIMNSLSQIHTIGTLCMDFIESKKGKIDDKEKMRKDFKEILNKLQIEKDVWNFYPFELSGGQLQRVIIAIAVFVGSKIIVLDEPTSALDFDNENKIIELLKLINREYNKTIIFISHSEYLIENLSNKIIKMYDGEWELEKK